MQDSFEVEAFPVSERQACRLDPIKTIGGKALVALVAGALMVLAFAPFQQWYLAFLSLGILYWQLVSIPTKKQAALIGWSFGFGLFLGGVSWIWFSLSENGLSIIVATIAIVLLCVALSGYTLLSSVIFSLFIRSKARILAFAGIWTLIEWLRGTLFTGFSWLDAGYVHAGLNPLSGYGPLLGVYGLSFITALIAAALVEIVTASRKRLWRNLACWSLIPLTLLIGGCVSQQIDYTKPVGPIVPVSMIQGNVPMDLKWGMATIKKSQYLYWDLTLRSRGRLIIWPETGIPRYLDDVEADFLNRVIGYLSRNDMALITGISLRDSDHVINPDYRSYNSLLGLDGEGAQFYHKFHLVPFGEYIPQSFRWIVDAFLPMSDFTSANDIPNSPLIMNLAGLSLAPTICYEDAFGEEILEGAKQASVLINVSNLAWFGDYMALEQHFQMSRMRAIETGRPMLSVTNTGTTGAIAPDGRIMDRLPRNEVGILELDIQGYEGTTPYLHFGNIPILILSFVVVLLAFFWKERKIEPPMSS